MTRRARISRSASARQYRRLYRTAEWKRLQAAQLKKQPLCERCLNRGVEVRATIVHHRMPHRGNLSLMFDPMNLESVCKPHHDGAIQADERRGYSAAVDVNGYPIDPNHPANRG